MRQLEQGKVRGYGPIHSSPDELRFGHCMTIYTPSKRELCINAFLNKSITVTGSQTFSTRGEPTYRGPMLSAKAVPTPDQDLFVKLFNFCRRIGALKAVAVAFLQMR